MKCVVQWYDGNDNMVDLVKFENPIYRPYNIGTYLRLLPKFNSLYEINSVVVLPEATQEDMIQVGIDNMIIVAEVGSWQPEEQQKDYVYLHEIDLDAELGKLPTEEED